ncbi:MAG: radical SAM protein [Patescibacteria group bacterium]|jgi:radical SAM superfamily enzyme YgiQ (UPF0313 family)
MKRVILVIPPLITNRADLKKSALNLGTWYLGSALKNLGHHEVQVIDSALEGWGTLRKTTSETLEYGLPDKEITQRISDFKPDVIGITLLATVGYTGFLTTAKLLKQYFPNIPLVCGGAHASALPEKTLRDSLIDYVVTGEGEVVMGNIVANLDNPSIIQQSGSVAYLDRNNKFCINPPEDLVEDLDCLGSLDLELIQQIPLTPSPTYAGSAHGEKYLDVILSRGCPNKCGFCCTPWMWGQKFRKHSLSWISNHLRLLRENGYSHVIVQDDNFSRGGDWAIKVMRLFKKHGLSWENNGGLELENLTPELIDYMADTNCRTLFIPINLRGKTTDQIPEQLMSHYRSILGAAKKRGLWVYTSHIMGFPEQTILGMENQIKFAKNLRDEGLSDFHVVYCFSLLPGTRRFHEIMESIGGGEYRIRPESGIELHGGWQNWSRYSINIPQLNSRNFTFQEVSDLFFSAIRHINGDRGELWFSNREWPK